VSLRRLIIFAKAPVVGNVKSRIASVVGAEAACEIYTTILRRTFSQLSEFSEVQVRVTPDASAGQLAAFTKTDWRIKPQGDGNLGDRLHRAFARAFEAGSELVLIIGSDCPDVTADDINVAWRKLEECDLVVGPASDGGYWLIGLRRPCPELFEGIEWSSEKVLRQTIERAEAARLRIKLLRELSDIDTIEDWNRYQAREK